ERLRAENADLSRRAAAAERERDEVLEQQTATAEVLRAISASPADPSRALHLVAESAARFAGLTNAAINQVEGDALRVVAQFASFAIDQSNPLSIGALVPM